jgi:rubrerythrin
MPQEFNLQEALKLAIHTEKNVRDFYLRAAGLTRNQRGKEVFELLAREEQEHASHFFPLYRGGDLGSFEEFMASPAKIDTAMHKELSKALDENIHERRAMEIALREEEDLEKNLRRTAANIIDPVVRAVFEKMATETRNHYQLIESEYARLMAMVHETEINTYVRE